MWLIFFYNLPTPMYTIHDTVLQNTYVNTHCDQTCVYQCIPSKRPLAAGLHTGDQVYTNTSQHICCMISAKLVRNFALEIHRIALYQSQPF